MQFAGRFLPTTIRSFTVDFDTASMTVESFDGRTITESFEQPPNGPQHIRRATFYPRDSTFTLIIDDDYEIQAEVAVGPNGFPSARPVVYLDQNHWITLAQLIHAPHKVRESERTAGRAIIDLARTREIVLPLSAAHLTETARAEGRWRRQLAPLMVDLSRGWQMVNPLIVRRAELRQMFRRYKDPTIQAPDLSVFGLEPYLIFATAAGEAPQQGRSSDPRILPGDAQDLIQRLTWISSLYEVLLEDEADDQEEGLAIAAAWASSHQDLADHLRAEPKARQHAFRLSMMRVISDLEEQMVAAEALAAGLTELEFRQWLESNAEASFSSMPMLGIYQAAIHQRILNADDHWEANDLNDMMYLACAAGYADVVVGERKATGYLNRATARAGERHPIVRSLEAAMPLIAGLVRSKRN